MLDLTDIFSAVLALLAALVTAFLLPWLKQKLGAEKLTALNYWLTVAVEAAEERFKGGGRGEEKLAFVEQFLAGRGFKLDAAAAKTLIEGTVWDLINSSKELTIPPGPEGSE